MKLVVIERDGVINQAHRDGLAKAEDWLPIADSLEAIGRLNRGGYRVVVASDQRHISREYFDIEELHDIHTKMIRLTHEASGVIDAIFLATADDSQLPSPQDTRAELLEQIINRYHAEPSDVILVTGSAEAAETFLERGVRVMLVSTDPDTATRGLAAIHTDLAGAVDAVLTAT